MRATGRLLLRATSLSILILLYIIHLSVGSLFVIPAKKRFWRSQTSRFYCRLTLRLLGIAITIRNSDQMPQASLLLANHISYVDVLVLSAFTPSVFISTVEVMKAPLIGWLTRLAGGLFIERRKRSALGQETDEISNLLKKGHVLCVFPEGTSTDGSSLLPFKSPILASAAKAQVPIVPVCIRYEVINNTPISRPGPCDPIAFYRDMIFFTHLFTLLKELQSARVTVSVFPPITITSSQERKTIAGQAHSLINAHLSDPHSAYAS